MGETDLDFLHIPSLQALIIAHCPHLIMPRSLQNLTALLGVQIYNTTIAEWNASAAITKATHPNLNYCFIVCTNMSSLPEGVWFDPPLSFVDLEITHTNLTDIPDDLDRHMMFMMFLFVQHSLLTKFPEPFLQMQVNSISLVYNQITELPTFPPSAFGLDFTGNPVSKLPTSLLPGNKLEYLYLMDTRVTALPDWASNANLHLRVYGTPFCTRLAAATSATQYANDHISCTNNKPYVNDAYPLWYTAPLLNQ